MDKRILRILIIEDNRDIAENIADHLEPQGHILDFALDGISGLHLALTEPFDVIVLDIMLPGMDGLTLCRKLREEADARVPVLMLTARDTLPDKLAGFDAGADDYLVKPFSLRELSARLQALTKRAQDGKPSKLCVEDLEVDTKTTAVKRAGRAIELNKTCMKILVRLMKAYPGIVSRQDIEHDLWGDMPPGSDVLRSHMYTLRHKIDKPDLPRLIHTIHGVGYRIGKTDEIPS